jgi:hypothetical protein
LGLSPAETAGVAGEYAIVLGDKEADQLLPKRGVSDGEGPCDRGVMGGLAAYWEKLTGNWRAAIGGVKAPEGEPFATGPGGEANLRRAVGAETALRTVWASL